MLPVKLPLMICEMMVHHVQCPHLRQHLLLAPCQCHFLSCDLSESPMLALKCVPHSHQGHSPRPGIPPVPVTEQAENHKFY